MRINPKIYNLITTEAIETQELEGHIIEIYCLNDYPSILEEFTKKGKFAVWSSIDGTNYRLLIEKGYHQVLKDLYGKRINTIWLKFWDECEKVSSTFSKKVILPLTVVVMACMILFMQVIPDEYQMYFSVGLLGIFIIGTMTLRKVTNNKINIKNSESIEEIKKVLGTKKFDDLLEKQRNYIDEYFGYNNEEIVDADIEETADKVSDVNAKENVIEAVTEEINTTTETKKSTKKTKTNVEE